MGAADPYAGIRVDRSSPVPLYHQVATALEAAIRAGDLPIGSFLPNEVVLAARFGLSRPTMRQALSALADAGFLERQRGVGTRVIKPVLTRKVALTSLYEYLEAEGEGPVTRVLSLERRPVPEDLAQAFAPEQVVWEVSRLRSTTDGPLAVMHNWLPGRFELDAEALTSHGLYAALRAQGLEFRRARQRIGAVAASAAVAELLGVKKGAACLTLHREAFDQAGLLGEIGDHVYRADRYTIESVVEA
ncbi:MAG: GntR family transcriptional regulator [Bifidobacteriaceae bacterium]|jgi:DNA-binding GntR family transcriptional regulator|nr:GntR family transcriptional regulator [Bifidobacteriaceae bacterium]